MNEFMLLIRNDVDSKNSFSTERDQQFLDACRVYVEDLKKNGKLISAQPLIRDGKMISGVPGAFKNGPYNETREVIVGYYHVLAKDMDEAISIAHGNPEFAFTTTARVEVRPIKMKEEATGYVYPKGE